MANISERRILRRIPVLRSLSGQDPEAVQDRMIYRSYRAGDVIWRTRGPLRLRGSIQSGVIELEYRVGSVPVRTTQLSAGDPLPPRALRVRRLHDTVIATALTDVRIGILPEAGKDRTVVPAPGPGWMGWLWPVLLLLLIALLARDDLARITSGLFYLAASPGEGTAPHGPLSMGLLRAAQKVDREAAFAYNEAGYRRFQQGQFPDAEAAFEQAVDRDPANAPALNNLAITYFARGELIQAEGYLQRAIEQNPDNPIPRYNLGITLMQMHDPSGAIREFREAGFIDPGNSLALLQQAYLYNQVGDYANAEQRARSVVQLNPSLTPAHILLGMALDNQGRDADALDAFTQALSLEPGNRTAAFYQALILGHLKQYDVALPLLHGLLNSATSASETARILAEIDALYRFQADPAAAGR